MKFKSSCWQSLKASSVSSLPLESSRADAQNAHARISAPQNFAGIDAAHHRELREVKRLAFDVRAGVEQDKFISLPGNDRGNAAAIHAGNAADLERGRREDAAGVAERNQGVGLAFVTSSAARAMELSRFLRSALAGLSSISTTSLAWTTRTRWSRKPRAGRAAWISA